MGERGKSGDNHAPPLLDPPLAPVASGGVPSALLQSCSPRTLSPVLVMSISLSSSCRGLSWKQASRLRTSSCSCAACGGSGELLLLLPRLDLGEGGHPSTPRQLARCDLSPCHLLVLRVTSSRDNHFRLWEPSPEPSPGPATRLPSESRGALAAHQRHHRPFRPTRRLPDRRCPVRDPSSARVRLVRGAMPRPKCPPIVVCLPRGGMGILSISARIPSPENCIISLCTLV